MRERLFLAAVVETKASARAMRIGIIITTAGGPADRQHRSSSAPPVHSHSHSQPSTPAQQSIDPASSMQPMLLAASSQGLVPQPNLPAKMRRSCEYLEEENAEFIG
eukprot:COSAG01_NODE_17206_length_1170_cov_1.497666_1_plen_106_part_00